jgi:adenine deaminase
MKNIERLSAVAAGRIPADTVIADARILDVFTGEFLLRDIALCDGYIAGIGAPGTWKGNEVLSFPDKYITPGFIDAHVHIESSMVLPPEFARTVIDCGTTAVIADSHEIANVLGPDAVRFMADQAENSPIDIYFMIPSCVPATPFEHAGGSITAGDIASLLNMPRVLGLGELMNYPGVISADTEILAKIHAAAGRLLDGHAPLVTGHDLQAYCSCGITTDHECHQFDEAVEKIRAGMFILIRNGSTAHDLVPIVKGIVDSGFPTDRFAFCTDDRNVSDILADGHISACIRTAILLGLPPGTAYRMATWNAATCYGLPDTGALCAGYRSDFVILDDINSVSIHAVFKDGQRVEKNTDKPANQICLENRAARDSTETTALMERACRSIHIGNLDIQKFRDKFRDTEGYQGINSNTEDTLLAIGITPGSLNTHKQYLQRSQLADLLSSGTACRLAVIERHRAIGSWGIGLLSGYGLKTGAIASTIGHDSHNIICAGIDPDDMYCAIRNLEDMQGGICIVRSGRITAALPLQVAGLMSTESAETVRDIVQQLKSEALALGIPAEIEPFVTLSFLALPVIPELRLTDQGYFDVTAFSFI